MYTGSSRKSSKFAHGDSLSQTPEKKCTLTRRDGAAVKRLRRQLIPIPEDPIIPEIKEATPPTLGRFSHVSKDQVSISQTDSPKCLEQIFGSNTVNFGASNQGKREQSKQNNKSDQEPYFRRKEAAPSPSSSQIVSPILNRSWQLPSSPMLPATLSSPINASSSFYEHTSNASPLQKIISQSEEVIVSFWNMFPLLLLPLLKITRRNVNISLYCLFYNIDCTMLHFLETMINAVV